MICAVPLATLPPPLRFRIEETYTYLSDPPETRWLPPTIELFSDNFILIENDSVFESPESGYLGIINTQSYAKKLELKECFPPVLIKWKHYTKAASDGAVTSTDEEQLLDKANPSYTWPIGTEYVASTTDGEWDADFEMHQTV